MHDTVASRLAQACPSSRQHLATRPHLEEHSVGRNALARCLRDGSLVRVRRSVYALGPLPERGRHLLSAGRVDPAYLAEVRAVLLSLGDDAVADRRTAAVLWRMDMLVEPSHVHVRVPRSRTRVQLDGVRVRCSSATVKALVEVAGLEPLAVTPALDTVVQCCLDRPLVEAVVIADSALRRGLVSLAELQQAAAAGAARPGSRRVQRVVELVDPASESVLESMLRVLLVQHGLHPESQVALRSRAGRLLARVDLCFTAARLVVECDGRRWHDPDDARRRDRHRDNALARAGWRVLRFSWDEVQHSPAYVVAAVREALLPVAA